MCFIFMAKLADARDPGSFTGRDGSIPSPGTSAIFSGQLCPPRANGLGKPGLRIVDCLCKVPHELGRAGAIDYAMVA